MGHFRLSRERENEATREIQQNTKYVHSLFNTHKSDKEKQPQM
jgi:hypothetical protein